MEVKIEKINNSNYTLNPKNIMKGKYLLVKVRKSILYKSYEFISFFRTILY